MSDVGDKTTSLQSTPLADEVLVNRNGSTGRQSIDDLALQISGAPAIADSIMLATLGIRTFESWAALALMNAGNKNGQTAVVVADNGQHTDPLGNYTVPNRGTYRWVDGHNSWHWVSDYRDTATVFSQLYGTVRNAATVNPIRIDRSNRLGGGPAVYVPRLIFLRLPALSIVKSGNVGNDEAEELPGYVKFPLTSASPDPLTITYDAANGRYFSTASNNDPAGGGAASKLVPICTVWGGSAWSLTGFPIVEYEEDRLKARLWPEALAFQRPVILDAQNFYGGGAAVYVPRIFFLRRGPWKTDIIAVNPECAELVGYCKLSLKYPQLGILQVVFLNAATGTFEITDGIGEAFDLKLPALDRVFVIGSLLGSTITSSFDWQRPSDNLGENQCIFGKNIDLMPSKVGTVTDIAEPNLRALGFTRGVANAAGPLVGMNFSAPVSGARCFFRCYMETDTDDQYNTPHLFIYPADWTQFRSYPLIMEKRISARAARFSVLVDAAVRDDLTRYLIGSPAAGTAQVKVTGVQHHMSMRRVQNIGLTDYPSRDRAIPGDVDEFAMAYPPHMFLVSGRPLPLFPANLMKQKSELLAAAVTFYASPKSPGKPPVVITNRETILIDGKDCGTAGGIEVRRHGATVSTRYRIPLTIHAAPAQGSGIVRYLPIGDSLTVQEQPKLWALKMQDLGYTASTIGTLENGSTGDFKGEGREGREWSDLIYERTIRTQPVPAGSEASYLAMSVADRVLRNPFLKEPTASDKQNKAGLIYNGYIFDLRFYLNRFGFPDPDIVSVNLIRNDISFRPPEETLAQLERGFAVVYAQTRAALPNAHIGFILSGDARSVQGDTDWQTDRWPTALLRQMQLVAEKRTAGDSKVWIVPVYAHQSAETGYGVSVQATAAPGMQTLSVSDYVHFIDHGRHAYAEPVVAWSHAVKAGV